MSTDLHQYAYKSSDNSYKITIVIANRDPTPIKL